MQLMAGSVYRYASSVPALETAIIRPIWDSEIEGCSSVARSGNSMQTAKKSIFEAATAKNNKFSLSYEDTCMPPTFSSSSTEAASLSFRAGVSRRD